MILNDIQFANPTAKSPKPEKENILSLNPPMIDYIDKKCVEFNDLITFLKFILLEQ